MEDNAPVKVSAALIWRDNKFLICQRPANKARGLLWEFVGGKTEPGETGEQALVRECREELGVTVEPEDVYARLVHVYPDITVELTLYNAKITGGEPKLLEHAALEWITPSQIPAYSFCPADTQILKKLMSDTKCPTPKIAPSPPHKTS